MNYYAFLIIAVFISGPMVGRLTEFLGVVLEAREMKIATMVVLMHPFLILVGTGLASWLAARNPELASGWLNNPSFHGLSEKCCTSIPPLGRQQRFRFRRTFGQYAFLEHHDRYCPDYGSLFPDCRTGGDSRAAGRQVVRSRKRRYAQDRYGDLLGHDLRRHHHRGSPVILPCTRTWADSRLSDFLNSNRI